MVVQVFGDTTSTRASSLSLFGPSSLHTCLFKSNFGFVTVLLLLVGNTHGFGYWYDNSPISAHFQLLSQGGPFTNTRWTGKLMNCRIKLCLWATISKITSYSIEVSSKLYYWETANLYWHLWTWNVTKEEKELKKRLSHIRKRMPPTREGKPTHFNNWADDKQNSWIIALWWLSVSLWWICITFFWPSRIFCINKTVPGSKPPGG